MRYLHTPGKIDLQSANVQSQAFTAAARGNITLEPVLTNSAIRIPVTVAVNQSIGRQLNLVAGSAHPGTNYVALPKFLTLTGTLGVPKTDINKLALGTLAVKSLGGGLLNTGTNAASGVEHLLNNLIKKTK